jgi:hypothetical protein
VPLTLIHSQRALRGRLTATMYSGSSGICGLASTTGRGWSCTKSGGWQDALSVRILFNVWVTVTHPQRDCVDERRYEDQGRVRPVLYRASTVEIIVPYGDPRECASLAGCLSDMSANVGMMEVTRSRTYLIVLFLQVRRSTASAPLMPWTTGWACLPTHWSW